LVRVLPQQEFFFLRTDRNRFRLTMEQQRILAERKIGVVGLSVGQATALTLTLEGVGGHFKLADFDTLGLSNLNRLRTGVHNLGVNKAVLAAREMYEFNPYVRVDVYRNGMSEETLDDFLLGGGRLDLLVEECDDLAMKVRLRERARELRMPVLMETSDRGMLDVERFDLEPDRPLLHGLISSADAKALAGLPTKEKIPFFLRVLDEKRMSDQLLGSLIDIKTSISSWPQLASAVALGGAVLTDTARRLLLGQFQSSGRFYVDLADIVREGCQATLDITEDQPEASSSLSHAPEALPKPAAGSGEISEEEVRYIAAHAIMAPSAGNSQPWNFQFADGRLHGYLDFSRGPAWRSAASFTAIGCALENICIASRAIGLSPDIHLLPDPMSPALAFTVTFSRITQQPVAQELHLVYERVTNRRWGDGRPLAEADAAALRGAICDSHAQLHLLQSREDLARIGTLLGAIDRFSFTDKNLHHEVMDEIRWTQQEAHRSRDGLELASLELAKSDEAGMRVLRQWRAMDFLRTAGAGRGLEIMARKATAAASAVGLLTYRGLGNDSYLLGGRTLARIWGTASARGLAFQPHTPITYLFARLERSREHGFTQEQVRTLEALRQEYRTLFNLQGDEAEVILFRVSYAGAPTVRSMRRELNDVLSYVSVEPVRSVAALIT
jgi:molybdopterin/thiamine biosynthesis adenylyltransferase